MAAGIARRLGIDPLIVRVGFIADLGGGRHRASALYLLAWALMPGEDGERAPIERIAGRRETWLVVAGMHAARARRAAAAAQVGHLVQRRDRVAA